MWEKVKTHVFEFDGDIIAFDIHRSRPYLIDSVDKAMLRLRPPIDESHTIQQLDAHFSVEAINASIQKLRNWRLLIPVGEALPDKPKESAYPKVTHLELNIAEDCNLRCAYCCVGQGGFGADKNNGRTRGKMDWEIVRRSIDLLFKESLDAPEVHIRFFGGEPLMNWQIIEQSVYFAEEKANQCGKRVNFSIVTNGVLLDKHIIEFMGEHNFWVQVSIDGTPQMHDAFRLDVNGQGSYAQATKNIRLLLETLTPKNVHARGTITHLKPDVLEAFDHLRGLGFIAPELRPVTGHNPNYGMTIDDYLRYNEGLSVLARRLLESKPGEAGQYKAIFTPYLTLLTSKATRRPPCGAGRNMIGVSIDGSILPCTDMVGKDQEALQFGDVNSGLRGDTKQHFLEIVDVENKIGCRNCWARYLCCGACASVELGNEGGLDRNAGLECIWIRHVIELSIWLYVKMCAERPDLFYELYERDFKVDWGPLAEIISTG